MNEWTSSIHDVLSIGVPVSDQDRALEFDLQILGFEKRREVPLPQFGGRWIEVGELLRWPGVPAMFVLHDQDNNRLAIVEVA